MTELPLPQIEPLIDFVKKLDASALPQPVLHQAKRAILDGLAAMSLGARETDVADVDRVLDLAGSSGPATVVGRTTTRAFLDAAEANGSLCQVHDANDGMAPDAVGGHVTHPGRTVIPAALTLAERYDLAGRDLLALVVAGYEAAGRVRDVPGMDWRLAFVSAMLTARLRGLDMPACRNAMGLAFYQSPSFCVLDYTGKGLDDYALAMGRGVRVGIASALQAEAGYRCPTFDPSVGHAIRIDLDALGERFCIDRLYFKPFAACRSVHGPAEAAMSLRREHEFSFEDISSVTVELAGQAMYTARPIDMDTVDRITSAANPRYVTACGLVDGEIRLDRFRDVGMKDPDVFALIARTTVIENSEFTELHGVDGRPTRLTLTMRNGRTLTKEVRHAYGAPANPMTDDDLGRKFVRYAGAPLPTSQADRIVDTVFNLDNVDTTELTALLQYAAR